MIFTPTIIKHSKINLRSLYFLIITNSITLLLIRVKGGIRGFDIFSKKKLKTFLYYSIGSIEFGYKRLLQNFGFKFFIRWQVLGLGKNMALLLLKCRFTSTDIFFYCIFFTLLYCEVNLLKFFPVFKMQKMLLSDIKQVKRFFLSFSQSLIDILKVQ